MSTGAPRPRGRSALVVAALVLAALVAAIFVRCRREPHVFARAIQGASVIILHEGLPHPTWEPELLTRELATKRVQDLYGHPFYPDPLPLTPTESRAITTTFAATERYLPFSGEKKCGGFHPDYAVEWRRGGEVYMALICFGCEEVKLFGPGIESRHDLTERDPFIDVLSGHVESRPRGKGY